MKNEAYLIFDDHEDFRRAVEKELRDRKELQGIFAEA